jgi:hypothetical protein
MDPGITPPLVEDVCIRYLHEGRNKMKEQFIDKNFGSQSLNRVDLINDILEEYRSQGFDLSLRQLYYQLVARDYIENSVHSYKRLGSLVNNARLAGLVDWSMIVDRSRTSAIDSHWDNPGQIIRTAADSFQIDKWEDQPNHIEVVVEKDALSGVLMPVCQNQDIYFTANKGYPSASLLYRMSKRLLDKVDEGKNVYILHLGDHDPSGVDMTRDLRDRLFLFCGLAVDIKRLALNMDQVEKYDPPENPAKLTDTRGQKYVSIYGYSSWELDALEPKVLASLVHDFVDSHKDHLIWQESLDSEAKMQSELSDFADKYGD